MSKTGDDRLDAILSEWVFDMENTPPNRLLRAWVGHFHIHRSDYDDPHECLGAVIAGSRLQDVPVSLSPYKLSQQVTCSALILQANEREFVVSHTGSSAQWRVSWSLDDRGRVWIRDVRPTIHLSSKVLLHRSTRGRHRGRMSLVDAVTIALKLPRGLENEGYREGDDGWQRWSSN